MRDAPCHRPARAIGHQTARDQEDDSAPVAQRRRQARRAEFRDLARDLLDLCRHGGEPASPFYIAPTQRKREKIGSYIGIAIGLVRLIPTILFLVPILVPMLILGQVIESIRKILGVEDKEPNGSA
jgi:hypothetical protein